MDIDIRDQEKRLHDELLAVLDHFASEFEMTYPQIIGILSVLKEEMLMEFFTPEGEGKRDCGGCDEPDGEED